MKSSAADLSNTRYSGRYHLRLNNIAVQESVICASISSLSRIKGSRIAQQLKKSIKQRILAKPPLRQTQRQYKTYYHSHLASENLTIAEAPESHLASENLTMAEAPEKGRESKFTETGLSAASSSGLRKAAGETDDATTGYEADTESDDESSPDPITRVPTRGTTAYRLCKRQPY